MLNFLLGYGWRAWFLVYSTRMKSIANLKAQNKKINATQRSSEVEISFFLIIYILFLLMFVQCYFWNASFSFFFKIRISFQRFVWVFTKIWNYLFTMCVCLFISLSCDCFLFISDIVFFLNTCYIFLFTWFGWYFVVASMYLLGSIVSLGFWSTVWCLFVFVFVVASCPFA